MLLTVVVATVIGGGLSVAAAAGPRAGKLVSMVNANAPDRATGGRFDAVQLTAPAACDPAATRHLTRIIAVRADRSADKAAARQWVGDNLYATASVGLPGPLTVRSNGSWQQLADAYGQRLVPGTYVVELRCQDNLAQKIFQTWTGEVRFSSSTRWTGFTAAETSSARPSTATTASAGTLQGRTATTFSPAVPATAAGTGSGSTSPTASTPASPTSTSSPLAGGSDPMPSTPKATVDQAQRGSDPAVRKYLVLGLLAVVGLGGLLVRSVRRAHTGPAFVERR